MNLVRLKNILDQEEIDHAPHLEALLETCDLDLYREFLGIYDGDMEYLTELFKICVENLIDSTSSSPFKSFYVAHNSEIQKLFEELW